MPVSNAKKKANAKWDSANMSTISCKLRKDKADAFRAACQTAQTTPNAVLTQAVNAFLERANSTQAALDLEHLNQSRSESRSASAKVAEPKSL